MTDGPQYARPVFVHAAIRRFPPPRHHRLRGAVPCIRWHHGRRARDPDAAPSSLAIHLKANIAFMLLRSISSAILIPILEELFWRGWLMRWLIDKDFLNVPLGKYAPSAFWILALLFASEHGPFWEVGLAAGIVYNWWIVRTRNLADCILAHGITNAVLCVYVLATGQWQYWL